VSLTEFSRIKSLSSALRFAQSLCCEAGLKNDGKLQFFGEKLVKKCDRLIDIYR
jgi:hypothetical protein